MRAGQLRERVDIQRPIETKGAGGGVTVTYATEMSGVPARVEYQGGRKYFDADTVLAAMLARVTMRYVGILTLKHVLRLPGGEMLRIHSIQPDERRRELQVLCERATT